MDKPPRLTRVAKEWTPPTVAIAIIAGVARMWTEPSPAQAAQIAAINVQLAEANKVTSQHGKDIDKLTDLYVEMDHRLRAEKDETMKLLYQVATAVSRIEGKLDQKKE